MIDDIDQLVTNAVSGVFGTMLKIPVHQEPPGAPIRNGEPHVAGSVGFIGNLTGVIYVYSTQTFARKITRGLLGEKCPNPGDEMVNDAIGEIANMIVGNIKSHLVDRGLNCVMTIPSVLRGSHFSVEPTSSTRRHVTSYECDGHQLVVEVLLRSTDTAFAV
jgi:chemotaxis protein CheX